MNPMPQRSKPSQPVVAVIGGGSWGTALVKVLQYHGTQVIWWVRREAQKAHLMKEHHNPDYLSYTEFDISTLTVSTNLQQVIAGAEIIILAVPSAFVHQVFESLDPKSLQRKIVISAVKGIEPVSSRPVYEWLIHRYGIAPGNIGVIGGPCHSEEVAMQRLSFLTLGVFDPATGERMKELLQTPYLAVLISQDVAGISMASVLKNVYGILAGVAGGLGYGDNFQAVLATNAISEMQRLLNDLSGEERDIHASVYAGDLLVTAYSRFSRNWMFGNLIGKGYPVKSAMMELKMVAEGYFAAASLAAMDRIHMNRYPMLEAVYQMLYKNEPPDLVISKVIPLMR